MPVKVQAAVELDGTVLLRDLKEELRLRLERYYHGAAMEEGEVRYTSVGALLRACAGVTDYDCALLRINGSTRNIPLSIGQIPVTTADDLILTEGTVS